MHMGTGTFPEDGIMRWLIIGTCLLTLHSVNFAQPDLEPPPFPPNRSAEGRELEAQLYAQSMLNLTRQIADQYVKPVKQSDLMEAGLMGLFEEAREPFPAWIGPELRRSKEDFGELIRIATQAKLKIQSADFQSHDRALTASFRGMPRVLDPFCGLVKYTEFRSDPNEYESGFGFELSGVKTIGNAAPNGRRRGLQAENTMELPVELPTPWRVGYVAPGSPAQRNGLQPNDLITHLNDIAITPENAQELFTKLRQAESGEYRLTIRRPPNDVPKTITMTRSVFQTESVFGVRRQTDHHWDHWLDAEKKIGYVRIGTIDRNTPDQLAVALQHLEEQNVQGVVLDLRWCPGGLLIQATQIAEVFLHEGLIASTKYRNSDFQNEREFRAGSSGLPTFHAKKYPVIVLVNADTSGGGELIASALKDNGRAKIAGQRTRGKASVQSAMDIPLAGLSFKITTGTFQRPNGKELQKFPMSTVMDDWGVRPDVGCMLPMTSDLSKQLREWYESMALRPGDSRVALPLDDPSNDPQREAARLLVVRALKK